VCNVEKTEALDDTQYASISEYWLGMKRKVYRARAFRCRQASLALLIAPICKSSGSC
jgi:hypothetical protein